LKTFYADIRNEYRVFNTINKKIQTIFCCVMARRHSNSPQNILRISHFVSTQTMADQAKPPNATTPGPSAPQTKKGNRNNNKNKGDQKAKKDSKQGGAKRKDAGGNGKPKGKERVSAH
jgi:hypothetical protein